MIFIQKIIEFVVIIAIAFWISLLVYLLLMPEHKKPTTYKEFTFDHFFK